MVNSKSVFTKIFFMLIIILLTIFGSQKVLAARPNSIGPVIAGQTVGGKTFFPIKYTNSNKVFCTSGINVDVPYGRTCKLMTSGQWNESTQAGVAAIITEYNKGNIKGTYNSYWYTEMAINSYIKPGSMIVRAENGENDALVKSLVSKAKTAANKANAKFEVELSESKLVFTKSGNYYVSNTIKVKDKNNYLDSFSVSVSGTKGVEVINKKSDSFQVRFPASNVAIGQTVSVTATVTATKSYKTAKNYSCGSGVQNVTIDYLDTTQITKKINISGKVTRKGNVVEITKVDAITGNVVPGAKLVLKDSNGKVIESWYTTTQAKKFTNLKAGTYKLTEEAAKKGYKKSSETKTITVKEDGQTIKVKFENYPETGVKVLKVDGVTGKAVAGAKLQVKNVKGEVVKELVSTTSAIELKIDEGEYTLVEVEAPKGYKKTSEPVKFTVDKNGTIATVTMKNYPETGVKVLKVDGVTGKAVAGAKLQVKNAKGEVVKELVSTTSAIELKIDEGEYTLVEVEAPKGYKKTSEPVKFTVDKNGTIATVTMKNYPETGAEISKQDVTTGKELPGATLMIKDSKGKAIKSWVSTNEPTYFELDPGKYTLTETIAPKGYKLSKKTVEFEVKEDGTVTKVVMENAPTTSAKISKQDITTKQELPGATLVVKDINGKEILKWVSSFEPTYFELDPGKYTLTETIAPKGYKLSTETIEFEVKEDGTTTNVIMYNEPNKTGAKISKQDITTKQELAGATLVIKDSTGKEIKKWVSKSEPTYFELDPGKYTLTETIAPKGYKLTTETVEFEVKDDGTVTHAIMYNEPVKTGARISKQDITNKEELPGATLVIKDINGNEVKTWVSTNEPTYFELDPGKYTLSETIAPAGYKLSTETIEFEVKDDGTITSVIMYNEPSKVGIKISKQDITTKLELPGATLVVKDINGNEIVSWISTSEPRYIELEPGEYTLTEISAPDGYDLSYEVVRFTVDSEGNATTDVVMYNSKTPVTADKNLLLTTIGFIGAVLVGAVAIKKIKHQM